MSDYTIFGTLEDGNLQINSLASNNNCFRYTELETSSEMVSKRVKKKVFVKKLKISFILDHTILLEFHQHMHILYGMYGETLEFEQNCKVRTTQSFELLMLNYSFEVYHLSVFQKLR